METGSTVGTHYDKTTALHRNRGSTQGSFFSALIDAAIIRRMCGARTIRIPMHVIETITKLNRISRQILQEMARAASNADIKKLQAMTRTLPSHP